MSKCCDDNPRYAFVPPFAGWTNFTPTVPKMYWDVKSQEQRIKGICEMVHKIICYADMLGEKININRADIDELQEQLEKFIESGFDDYYADMLEKWIDEHMPDIISRAIKMVFFGLTLDGYFVAYIPDSWDGIVFDTGAVYGSSEYGRLILNWAIDSEHDVEQDWITNKQVLESMRESLAKVENTLYTPMGEGGNV